MKLNIAKNANATNYGLQKYTKSEFNPDICKLIGFK